MKKSDIICISGRNCWMIIRSLLLILALLIISTYAYAKNPPAEQFVNFAPLPGDGIALNEDGKVDGMGAIQINIPVAYTPGNGHWNFGAYAGQWTGNHNGPNTWRNGTGVLGAGFGVWPKIYVSAMAVSSQLTTDSKVASAQMQILKETDKCPAFSVGAQDILNKEDKEFHEDYNTGVSYYGIATKKFAVKDHPVYASLGYGTARYLDRFFWGVSVPVNDYITVSTENDGFQYNTGIAIRPSGRYSALTILAAYNDEAGPLFGVNAAGKASSWYALPIFLLLLRP